MEKVETQQGPDLNAFTAIVKKAYDKGRTDRELTLEQLLEDLKADLKNLVMG